MTTTTTRCDCCGSTGDTFQRSTRTGGRGRFTVRQSCRACQVLSDDEFLAGANNL